MAKSSTMARIPREVHAEVSEIAEEKGLTFGEALRIWQKQTVTVNASEAKHSVSNGETGGFPMSQESQQLVIPENATREIVHRVRIEDERQNRRLDYLEDSLMRLGVEVAVNRSGIETMNEQHSSGEPYDPAQVGDVMSATREALLARGNKRLASHLDKALQVEAELVENDEDDA